MQTTQRFDIYSLDSKDTQVNKTPEGYLKITGAVLTRTGAFKYSHGFEYRSPSEVFAKTHLDSAEGKPITAHHPSVFVDKSNYKDLELGTVLRMYKKDGNNKHVFGDLIVKNPDALGNLRELSLGYEVELLKQDGVDEEGTPYQYVQKNMKVNHLAFVDKARAGSVTRLNLDSQEYEEFYTVPSRFDSNKNSKLDDETNSIIMTKEEMEKLQAENAELKKKADEAEAKASKAEALANESKTQIADLQKKLDAKDGEKAGLEKSFADLKARLDLMEAEAKAKDEKEKMNEVLSLVNQLGIKLDAKDLTTPKELMVKALKTVDAKRFDGIDAKSEEYIQGAFSALTLASVRKDASSDIGKFIEGYSQHKVEALDDTFNNAIQNELKQQKQSK